MNFLKNEKGGAMVMSMLALTGLIVVSMVVMERERQMKINSARDAADKDIALATSQIASVLASPADCNSNFAGMSGTGSLSEFRKCKTGSCRPIVLANTSLLFTAIPKSPANDVDAKWTAAATGISAKARINSINYFISDAQTAGTPPNAAQVQLTVNFEKISTQSTDYTIPAAPVTIRKTRNIQKVFKFPVAVSAGTITGCTRSPHSTYPY